MILADTSVIIDFWKNPAAEKHEIFRKNEIATCYVIKAELFCGAKSDSEKKKIEKALKELILLPINDEVWEYLGEILYKLKKNLPVPNGTNLRLNSCFYLFYGTNSRANTRFAPTCQVKHHTVLYRMCRGEPRVHPETTPTACIYLI